jgi:hypothetical protein
MGENAASSQPETVTISAKELEQLREDSQKLSALDCAGVDNWEGYDHAMEILREWNGEDK